MKEAEGLQTPQVISECSRVSAMLPQTPPTSFPLPLWNLYASLCLEGSEQVCQGTDGVGQTKAEGWG